MVNWLVDNSGILVAELIGALGTIIAVIITIRCETRRRKKEIIKTAKPIVINYDDSASRQIDSNEFIFEADNGYCTEKLIGSFKNTDNGILFIDYVQTETKIYYPKQHSVVDKNTLFRIILVNIDGETLKKCEIYCHDVYENHYIFDAKFDCSMNKLDIITLLCSEPRRIQTKNKKKK